MLFRAHGELQEAPRIAGGDDVGVCRRYVLHLALENTP